MREGPEFVVKKSASICLFLFPPFLSAIAASSSLANEPLAKVGPLVVTAARGAQAYTEVAADLTVIDQDQIEASGAASLVELLRQVSGVEITSNGGPGTASGVFLRGANAGHTLVLIDGVRVDSSTLGGTTLEALPLAALERIEVLRGPASSLYGADALGGVIQLFTRRGTAQPRLHAKVGGGSDRRLQADAGVDGGDAAWRYALAAGVEDARGFSAIRRETHYSYNPDRDGYRREHASVLLEYRLAAGQDFALQGWRARLASQFDAGADFDDRTRSVVQGLSAQYRVSPAARWDTLLRVAQGQDDSSTISSWGRFEVRTRQDHYVWQNDLALPLGKLQLALERREETVTSDTGYVKNRRDTDSGVASYRLNTGEHSLQASLRRDDSSQYGGKETGSLSYALRLAPGWRLSAAAGTAFKAPSFNDLYYPGFGNPDLRPESARNFEAGLSYAQGGLEAKALAYRNRVEDLIVMQCDLDFNCAPYNVAQASLRGVSLSGGWVSDGLSVRGHFDWQRPEDAQTGRWLPRRARQHGGLSLSRHWGAWRLGAEWQASGRRYEDTANQRLMSGYGLLNLSASYLLRPGWSLLARVNNVFDKPYELAKDYGTAGVNIFLTLQYRSGDR